MLLMSSIGVLIILLLISSIPAIAVYIWYRLARYQFSLLRFSFSLLAGAISFFPALLLQNFLSARNGIFNIANKWGLFAEIFARIAFTEELSRLIILIILVFVLHRLQYIRQMEQTLIVPQNTELNTHTFSITLTSAAGLVAGLGFAIIESVVYGASNPGSALLRTFTAAPLHGACGYRVGSAIAIFRDSPVRSIIRFLSAVIIHGVYNFMLIIPGPLPSIIAVLIALFSLASSILAIHNGMKPSQK